MEGDGSPLSSLCMVRAAELFPKPQLEKEDDKLKIPLTECKCKVQCRFSVKEDKRKQSLVLLPCFYVHETFTLI